MGGQSIAKFDFDIAPYVAKTFIKYFNEINNDLNEIYDDDIYDFQEFFQKRIESNKSLLNKDCFDDFITTFNIEKSLISRKFKLAYKKTNKATYQAMEGFIHNMNTLASRAGSQVPFSSINYGTDTSPEGRMVIKNLLYALDAGLGMGETPIFPIHVFKVKDGINGEKGDPNYDLFQLACKVSGKRLFPNFTFIDAPFNLQYYKEGHPETESATMGCVHGDSYIHVKSKLGEYDNITLFKCFWDKLLQTNVMHINGLSEYIDIENKDWYILDSKNNTYSKIKKVIRNPDMGNWIKIKIDNNIHEIRVTEDHPLQVMRDHSVKRIPACNITMADKLIASSGELLVIRNIEYVGSMNSFSYDVETESDTFDFNGIRSHNCRTRVVGNVDKENEIFTSRGNLSFITVNLPRLAILSNSIDEFFAKLDETLDLVVIALLDRYKLQSTRKVKNFPFLMGQGVYLDSEKLDKEDTVESVIKHGTLSIGFIGLAECLIKLIGKHHGESKKAQELGLKIIGHIRKRCDKETKEHNLNFSCIGAPAEGISGRLIDLDKKEFGIIKGVTDKNYYTNSNHVPVYYNISITNKINIEAPYHALTNAGHISYVEVTGDIAQNPKAFEQIIQYMKKAGIGYGSINHPVDRDPICGYVGIINDVCPRCGRREGEAISQEKLKELEKNTYKVNPNIALDEKLLNMMYDV